MAIYTRSNNESSQTPQLESKEIDAYIKAASDTLSSGIESTNVATKERVDDLFSRLDTDFLTPLKELLNDNKEKGVKQQENMELIHGDLANLLDTQEKNEVERKEKEEKKEKKDKQEAELVRGDLEVQKKERKKRQDEHSVFADVIKKDLAKVTMVMSAIFFGMPPVVAGVTEIIKGIKLRIDDIVYDTTIFFQELPQKLMDKAKEILENITILGHPIYGTKVNKERVKKETLEQFGGGDDKTDEENKAAKNRMTSALTARNKLIDMGMSLKGVTTTSTSDKNDLVLQTFKDGMSEELIKKYKDQKRVLTKEDWEEIYRTLGPEAFYNKMLSITNRTSNTVNGATLDAQTQQFLYSNFDMKGFKKNDIAKYSMDDLKIFHEMELKEEEESRRAEEERRRKREEERLQREREEAERARVEAVIKGIINTEAGDNKRAATLLNQMRGKNVEEAADFLLMESESAFGRKFTEKEANAMINRIWEQEPGFFGELNNAQKVSLHYRSDVAPAWKQLPANLASNLMLSTSDDPNRRITVQAITPPLYSGSAFNSWRVY